MNAQNHLAFLINEAARQRGHSPQQVQELVGITPNQYRDLIGGITGPDEVGRKTLAAIAAYCNRPAAMIFLAAGTLRLEDFVIPNATDAGDIRQPMARQFNDALRRMEQDPLIAGAFPSELWAASDAMKAFVVMMYEELTLQDLFQAQRYPEWVRKLHSAAIKELRREAELSVQ